MSPLPRKGKMKRQAFLRAGAGSSGTVRVNCKRRHPGAQEGGPFSSRGQRAEASKSPRQAAFLDDHSSWKEITYRYLNSGIKLMVRIWVRM